MRRFPSCVAACALLAVPAAAYAQTREIAGRVSINGNAPLRDAMVTVVGQPVGARTNERGEFRLRASGNDLTLRARSTGYKRQERRVLAGDHVANFDLQRDGFRLEGVSITGTASTVDRRNAGVALVNVDAEQISRVPAAALESALQGKVLGAQVSMNSGAPGGGGQIQIRGASSLIGRIDPLYVLDGVIISNALRANRLSVITGSVTAKEEEGIRRLADMNVDDIENVEILKGAAASAMYGSQGTNGVIMITTKRGRSGDTRVNVSQRIGTSNLLRKLGSRRFTNEADALAATLTQASDQDFARTQVASAFASGVPEFQDYQQQLFGETAPITETVLSISGGSGSAGYYLSGYDKREKGLARNTAARRQTLRFNLDQAIGTRTTAALGGSITRSRSQRGVSNDENAFFSPIYTFGYTPAIFKLNQRGVDGRYMDNPAAGSNPFDTYERLVNDEDVYRQFVNARVDFTPFISVRNHVQLSALAGADRFGNEGFNSGPLDLPLSRTDGAQGRSDPESSIQGKGTRVLSNGSLNAVHTFTPASRRFSAATSGGFQAERSEGDEYTIIVRGAVAAPANSVGAASTIVGQARSTIRTRSFYAQEQIVAFDERFAMAGALRGEHSSVKGNAERLDYFPRGQASYRFVDALPAVSELKLRAALGRSGNRSAHGARLITLTEAGPAGGEPGPAQAATLENPYPGPERMHEAEYGLDVTMFGERVLFEGTYYDRRIKDLLVRRQLSQTPEAKPQEINGGVLQSKGVELALTLLPIQSAGEGLNWTSRTTWYQGQTRILSFVEGVSPFNPGTAAGGLGDAYGRLRYTPGYSVSTIWGNQIQADGSVTPDTPLGDAAPQYQMTFGNDFTFGNFSVNTVADYRRGGLVSNMTLNLFDEGRNTWDYDAPSPDPRVGATLGEYRYNSWAGGTNTAAYLADGSFLKLREVTLGYKVPKPLVNALGGVRAKSGRLALSGRNLVMISGYNGFDPEVNHGGNAAVRFVDFAPFPPSRQFFLSVELSF